MSVRHGFARASRVVDTPPRAGHRLAIPIGIGITLRRSNPSEIAQAISSVRNHQNTSRVAGILMVPRHGFEP